MDWQRWDQNEVAGLYDGAEPTRQIKLMTSGLGIQNARVALPNQAATTSSS